MKKVAINGYGRIGRAFLRAYYERHQELKQKFEIVAINQPAKPSSIAYLTEFDSLYGKLKRQVEFTEKSLMIDDKPINLTGAYAPEDLHWSNIDILLEASGTFTDLNTANRYLARGAKKILFAQPASAAKNATIICGFNNFALKQNIHIFSAASCTTNCLIPIVDILQKSYKIEHLSATTLHSYMSDQRFLDGFLATDEQTKMRSAQSIVPIKTQLAIGVERLMPELLGKIIANHIRLPSLGASVMEICLNLEKSPKNLNELKELFIKKATGAYAGILATTNKNLVSVDFIGNANSAIIDLNSLTLVKNQLRILAWFDSEWGFANRLLDLVVQIIDKPDS